MSVSLPVRSHPSQVENSYSREATVAAIKDFYELLIKLPYISPNALVLPPKEGWSGVNAEELRRRGKTEEVIELLRHLPYLRAPAPRKRWMIGPDTIEIAYCDGEVYDKLTESMQPVPGHCIWLTDIESRDGTGLLLDTQTGTITEWTSFAHRLMIDYEEYEKLPTQDQWMAHATMPATVLLGLWKRRFEKLVWMALYNPRGAAGTAQWYCSVTSREEEEDMLASDDDYEPKGDGDEDAEEDGTESDGEGGIESEDGRILDEEVDTLMEDAYGEEAHQKRVELQSQESCADDKPTEIPHSEPTDLRPSRLINLERKTKEVYMIYKGNGWPSNFDRGNCRMGIAKFLEREEGPFDTLEELLLEQEE